MGEKSITHTAAYIHDSIKKTNAHEVPSFHVVQESMILILNIHAYSIMIRHEILNLLQNVFRLDKQPVTRHRPENNLYVYNMISHTNKHFLNMIMGSSIYSSLPIIWVFMYLLHGFSSDYFNNSFLKPTPLHGGYIYSGEPRMVSLFLSKAQRLTFYWG